MLNDKKNKGFTLLELLISVFILSVGILGAYVAIQKSATISSYSYDRLMAAYLAQEGIEIIRNIKDSNLLEGLIGSPIPWDEGLASNNYEVQYSDGKTSSPTLKNCFSGCEFTSLLPLTKDDFFYDYGSLKETKFRRKITIVAGPGGDFLNVSATVYWQDGIKIREFKIWDKFYNWL
jgi:prepilin-type N-terminal cleavage/methylation domain-containing protein